MPHLDVPGGSAELREPDQVPRKQARAFRKVLYRLSAGAGDGATQEDAARALIASSDGLDGIEDMADSLVFAVVESWTFGPVDQATLDNMPDAAVDAIYQSAISGGYMDKLMPDFGISPDDDSPTPPSGL